MENKLQTLEGLRVLVVEDDYLITVEVEDILRALKCSIVGPALSVVEALAACGDAAFDVAVLDMNLKGQSILPVVNVLLSKKLPFVLATGYPRRSSEDAVLRDARRIGKPFNQDDLEGALRGVLAAGPAADDGGESGVPRPAERSATALRAVHPD